MKENEDEKRSVEKMSLRPFWQCVVLHLVYVSELFFCLSG